MCNRIRSLEVALPDTRMILNDRFFMRVWCSKIPVPEIAAIYGTSRAAIYRAANRFQLEPRNPPEVIPVKVWPADPPKSLPAALIWSRGRWALLMRVADEHGLTSMQAQAAYHRARLHGNQEAD